MKGKIELLNGKPVFVFEEPDSRNPVMRCWVWPLLPGRQSGLGRKPDALIYEREATCRDGHVSVYLGDGVYWNADMPQLGQTPAIEITETPIPRPRACRNRVWIWANGKWQKKPAGDAELLMRRGYHVAA